MFNPAHRIFPLGKPLSAAFQDASVFTEAAVEEGQPGQPPKRRRMKWFWSRLSLRFQVVLGCYISAQGSGWLMAPLLVPADFWCDLDIPGDRDWSVAPSNRDRSLWKIRKLKGQKVVPRVNLKSKRWCFCLRPVQFANSFRYIHLSMLLLEAKIVSRLEQTAAKNEFHVLRLRHT